MTEETPGTDIEYDDEVLESLESLDINDGGCEITGLWSPPLTAAAARASRPNLIHEMPYEHEGVDGIICFFHTNPSESSMPLDRDEFKALLKMADIEEFTGFVPEPAPEEPVDENQEGPPSDDPTHIPSADDPSATVSTEPSTHETGSSGTSVPASEQAADAEAASPERFTR